MMRSLTLSAALGFLLVMGNSAHSQTPEIQKKVQENLAKEKAKKPPTLEELLAQALKNNPDIRVAEAKVRETEAELNRVRLRVTQKVVSHQQEVAAAKALYDEANARYLAAQRLFKNNSISQEEFRSAESAMQKHKADLARVEAELPYLLGSSPYRFRLQGLALSADELLFSSVLPRAPVDPNRPPESSSNLPTTIVDKGIVRLWDTATGKELPSLPAGTADKIRKALDTQVKVDFVEVAPKEILDYLQQHAKGFNLVMAVGMNSVPGPGFRERGPGPVGIGSGPPPAVPVLPPTTLKLQEPVPVGAIFQFLEDQYGWRFVVREYGIVVTEQDRVPPGAIRLHDFWKNRPAPATSPEKK